MKKIFSSYWLRSAFYAFLQRFSLTLFGFFSLALLTRNLTVPEYGAWAIFLVITTIFELTKSNLLKNAHIKYVGFTKDGLEHIEIASSSFLINSAITVVFILFIVFFADWLGHWFKTGKELAVMLRWFIPGMIFMVFFAHLEAVQQSFMDFKGGFAGSLVRSVSFFGVILWYKLSGAHLAIDKLSMYQSMSIGLGTIVLFLYTRKYLVFRFKPSMEWIKKILGYGGYIFGSGMVANISNVLDQMMVAKFISPATTAYYNVASRINLLVDIPSAAAAEIIFPKASLAALEEGREKVKYLFERMVAVLLAFTIPTAFFIILLPKLFTFIIAGRAYEKAALILQLYMVTGIFRPAQNQAANLMNSIGKPKLVFIANSIYLMIFLAIDYICLTRFDFYGAAIGTVITSFIGFTAWFFIMRREIDFDPKKVGFYIVDTYRTVFSTIRGYIKKAPVSPS